MSIINAKIEFLLHTKDLKVKCAYVVRGITHHPDEENAIAPIKLPVGYTEEQYNEFLEQLDFHYDSGYGSQYLEGIIWYENDAYSERGEYDGSEWWEYRQSPTIPQFLL